MSFEPDHPVTVFYLATESFRGGYRWLVRQYGAAQAVETGNEAFASEAEARKSGRRALIRTSAHIPLGRRDGVVDFDAGIDGQSVG